MIAHEIRLTRDSIVRRHTIYSEEHVLVKFVDTEYCPVYYMFPPGFDLEIDYEYEIEL